MHRIFFVFFGLKGLMGFVTIFVLSCLAWFIPYQEYTYALVESGEPWTYWFPNLRRILNVPFEDPERVSGTFVVLDVFFVVTQILFATQVRGYFRSHPEAILRVSKMEQFGRKFERVKALFGAVLLGVCSQLGLFWYGGWDMWMWGGVMHKNPFLFVLLTFATWWWAISCVWGGYALVKAFLINENK